MVSLYHLETDEERERGPTAQTNPAQFDCVESATLLSWIVTQTKNCVHCFMTCPINSQCN